MFNVGNCFFIRIQHLHPNCIGVRPHCACAGFISDIIDFHESTCPPYPKSCTNSIVCRTFHNSQETLLFICSVHHILPCLLVLSTGPVYSAHCIFRPRHVYIFGRCLRCEFLSALSPGQIVPRLLLTRTISRPRHRKQTKPMLTMIHSKATLGIQAL